MNKKGISMLVIVAIIVIAVVVGGIAAYYVLSSGDGGENGENGNGDETPDVEGATSITFDVDATIDGVQEFDKFTAKNLGTSDVLIRVDQTDAQGMAFIYLMNQTAQSAWADFGTGFTDQSEYFEDQYWNSELIGNVALESYMDALADGWTGTGDYEYEADGNSFVISNIYLNPTVDDSIFLPE